MVDALDAARGALVGLALGDALGMPTQSFSRAEIAARWGVLGGLEPGPADQPLAPGRPAGTVTDDTEQAVLLGRLLVDGRGRLDEVEFARWLVAWEDSMRARGSLDLLGPSTKAAVTRLLAGADPTDSGIAGTTNGAAMRVAPVGIAHPPGEPLVDAVVAASRITHHTSVALAGAAAVAAAVSTGVEGGDVADAMRAAVTAARAAVRRGHWVAAADVATRIAHLAAHVPRVSDLGPDRFLTLVGGLIGTSLATQESVPAAFAIVVGAGDDPWLALRLAASIGGDCDTIAAMVGAVLGACRGTGAFPEGPRRTVAEVNGLDLDALAADLLALRAAQQ